MMFKNILCTFCITWMLSLSGLSQNLHFIDFNGGVADNITIQDTLPCDHGGTLLTLASFHVSNQTSQPIDVKAKRFEHNFISGSETFFHWFVGYSNIAGTHFEFPVQGSVQANHFVTVNPGTSMNPIELELMSNGFCGESCYTIVAFDGNNPNDSIWVKTCVYFDSTITSIQDKDEIDMRVYPTLCSDKITFETKVTGKSVLSILNMQGKVLSRRIIRGQLTKLDVSQYTNGIYFYRLSAGKRVKNGKFIVQH